MWIENLCILQAKALMVMRTMNNIDHGRDPFSASHWTQRKH
jgi:hypothetical protein